MTKLSLNWTYVDNRARSLYHRMYNDEITDKFDDLTPYKQDFWRAIARAAIQEEEDLQAGRERDNSLGLVR